MSFCGLHAQWSGFKTNIIMLGSVGGLYSLSQCWVGALGLLQGCMPTEATSIDQFLFSLCVVLKNSCLVCLAFVSPLTGVVLYVCASWDTEAPDQECSAAGRRQRFVLPCCGRRGQWWRLWLGLGPHVTSFGCHVSILRAGEWNIQACKESFCWYPHAIPIQRALEIPACWLGWRWRGWFGSVCRALFALLQARQMHSFLLTVRHFCDVQQED